MLARRSNIDQLNYKDFKPPRCHWPRFNVEDHLDKVIHETTKTQNKHKACKSLGKLISKRAFSPHYQQNSRKCVLEVPGEHNPRESTRHCVYFHLHALFRVAGQGRGSQHFSQRNLLVKM